MENLTHVDSAGKARMVDVSGKSESLRTAEAFCKVHLDETSYFAVKSNKIRKGDVLTIAKIAGISAAKKTSELIPLCHNIFISKVDIAFNLFEEEYAIEINSTASTVSVTGVEMEAMTAASVAALTIYDMCKAVTKSIRITDLHLVSKTGGKSGDYKREG